MTVRSSYASSNAAHGIQYTRFTSDYLVSGAYDWMMTCEQSQEAITNLYKDEYYSRPENVGIRESMKRKFLRHTPYECVVEA